MRFFTTYSIRHALLILHCTLADSNLTRLNGVLTHVDLLFMHRNTYGLILSDGCIRSLPATRAALNHDFLTIYWHVDTLLLGNNILVETRLPSLYRLLICYQSLCAQRSGAPFFITILFSIYISVRSRAGLCIL